MQGGWDWVLLSYFVGCGVSRLARYNVTAETRADGGDKVKFFEGTPIPTRLAIVILLAVAAFLGRTGGDLWFGVWQLGPWQLHLGAGVRVVGDADGQQRSDERRVGKGCVSTCSSRCGAHQYKKQHRKRDK